jgi:hypothetical protein
MRSPTDGEKSGIGERLPSATETGTCDGAQPSRKAYMNTHFSLALGLFLSASAMAADLPPGSPPESSKSDVGYKTVAEALAALKLMKEASFSTVQGWTIVTDEAHLTVWSFAPKADPSYPSVVKRFVTSNGDGSTVTMRVLCESDKISCDNLVREFYNVSFRGGAAQPDAK